MPLVIRDDILANTGTGLAYSGGAKDRCRAIVRRDRAHMAIGRDQEQVSTTKHARTERDFPGDNLKYCELWLGICLAALIQ